MPKSIVFSPLGVPVFLNPGIPTAGRNGPCQARRSGEVEQLKMPLPTGDDDLVPP